ncbi:hypothetical protein P43SY_002849 [Pythium insidiosum]|uniref:Uncharacterized protein n=1 Tax=Pythium insidiosum TaxID=114742 RepID=A0AAD5M8X4_PYTIN|nr:hypothetical protein P43SY_002849 [Pythium insidiosum]
MDSSEQRFPWVRCVLSVVTYALALTDTVRAGLGMEDTKPYVNVEPDVLSFGPHAYQGVHLTQGNATASRAMPVWLYKHDSTSVTMRSVSRHLQTPFWPQCVITERRCAQETETVALDLVFHMLDALVSSVSASRPALGLGRDTRGHIALRTKFRWRDRLFDHVLPSLFIQDMVRSSQAIYFSPARLRDAQRPICGSSYPRPFACSAQWTRFSRFCGTSTALCTGIDDVWNNLLRRWRRLQTVYSNATLDAVLLEGSDDYTRGGFVFHGRKNQDVVIVTRVRDCRQGGNCSTVALDDYRYEGGSLPMSVANWYVIVALLRGAGQLYTWLRVLLLLGGAYRASAEQDPGASFLEKLRTTIHTFFLIPAQVAIYGSVVPIACYVAAYVLDSSAVSQIIRLHFSTPLGRYQFSLHDPLNVNAKAMRSVWAMAATCHALLFLHNRRSLSAGFEVPGISEFLITLAASTTILARVRSLAWRDTTILDVNEVSASAHTFGLRSMTFKPTRSVVSQLLTGAPIDVQFLGLAMATWAAATVLSWSIARWLPRVLSFRLQMISDTPVPYTAGFLWSRHAALVSWNGDDAAPARDAPKVLVNLVAMTDPLTLLRLQTTDAALVGEFTTDDASSPARVFLPLALRLSEMDVPVDWSHLRLEGVHRSRSLSWGTLLACG